MIHGTEESVSSWLRLRLSQRSQLTIAKTLLVCIPVYAIQHQVLNKKNQDRIEKLQRVLIWGGARSKLSITPTRLRMDMDGLAAYDLDAARVAWSIAWIARMERMPDLPWVQIAIPFPDTLWRVHNGVFQHNSKRPHLRHHNEDSLVFTHIAPVLFASYSGFHDVLFYLQKCLK
ncbi:hypothetical protein BDR22DRAFT_75086 [Usnea florida]